MVNGYHLGQPRCKIHLFSQEVPLHNDDWTGIITSGKIIILLFQGVPRLCYTDKRLMAQKALRISAWSHLDLCTMSCRLYFNTSRLIHWTSKDIQCTKDIILQPKWGTFSSLNSLHFSDFWALVNVPSTLVSSPQISKEFSRASCWLLLFLVNYFHLFYEDTSLIACPSSQIHPDSPLASKLLGGCGLSLHSKVLPGLST